MNRETALITLARERLARVGTTLFRNSVGLYYTKQGEPVTCGLARGSSDTVGWTRVVVTPAMVGRTVAVFTAIEFKAPGTWTEPKRLAEQTAFVEAVRAEGGIAGFASSVEQAGDIVRGR